MSDEVHDQLHIVFNTVEAIVWFAIAIGLAWRSLSVVGRIRSTSITAAVAFAAFGASDLVEIQTGAWYRPLWLFLWKAICVFVLAASVLHYRRATRSIYEGNNRPQ